jgi:hypothetical protein
MPFTPFHLGPALGFGLPLRKYLHVPTFLVASILVDVEPFLVLSLELDYPLHGYLHTFILTFILGLALGYAMFLSERFSPSLYKTLLLESNATPRRARYRELWKKRHRTYPSLHALFGKTIRRYNKKPIRAKQTRSITVRTPASTPMKKTSECVG